MTDFTNHEPLIYNRISEYQVRVFFWILALGFAGANAYTSRYFINDDAIVYVEIGEAIKQFRWHDVANFTFSPLYASLIAIFQSILQLNALNEIIWLKLLNYIIFVAALGALEVLLRFLKIEYRARQFGPESSPVALYSGSIIFNFPCHSSGFCSSPFNKS